MNQIRDLLADVDDCQHKADDLQALLNDTHVSARDIKLAFSLASLRAGPSPRRREELHRKLEKLAGLKLDELCDLLDKLLPRDGEATKTSLDLLRPMHRYLGIRRKGQDQGKGDDQGFYGRIEHALCTASPHALVGARDAQRLPFPLKVYSVGRIAVAGSYRSRYDRKHEGEGEREDENESGPRNVMSLSNFNMRFHKKDWESQDQLGARVHYQILLGRYDGLEVHEARPLCRCNLPVFDIGRRLPQDERFPTFFIRPELALPICLTPRRDCWEKDFRGHPVLAIIAVVLQRRSMRLDFLTRLLQAIKDDPHSVKGRFTKPANIHDVGGFFEEKDRAFLTDGWGDLLLMFTGNSKDVERRLRKIFQIQDVLYQDFMVDRTELILTPKCMPYAFSDKGGENGFRTVVQARLMEDRTALPVNQQVREHFGQFAERFDEFRKGQKLSDAALRLRKLPGRMDFSFAIEPGLFDASLDIGDSPVEKLFNIDSLDSIDTHIMCWD